MASVGLFLVTVESDPDFSNLQGKRNWFEKSDSSSNRS